MKYRFVGDTHGKTEAIVKALDFPGKVIFLGDHIDSYDRPASDHAICFRLVLDAIKAGKAESIYGNHELSYLMPKKHRCSGYTIEHAQLMKQLAPDIEKHFKDHIFVENQVLVTHAGVTDRMWQECKLTKENVSATLTEMFADLHSPVHYIGYTRGGFNPYGGNFWCDFRDFSPPKDKDKKDIELIQVFGHTRGAGIRRKGDVYCIDCLDGGQEFLDMELQATPSIIN